MKKIMIIGLLLGLTLYTHGQNNSSEKNGIGPDILNGLRFRALGPALTSGRISDIAIDPVNRDTWYITVASGGVWKTDNAGTTWTPIFDKEGSYSIGCITLDPNNRHTIWIGTGENNNQRSVGYGDGIYKSTDGGKSWENMGLINSEHIGNIVVHPENSDIIYVAAYGPLWSAGGDRGIYKSADGGSTWNRILHVSEHTGFNEIHIDPRDPDLLYAAAHQRRRHVFTYIGGGPESAVYKSTDGGKKWRKIMKGLPEADLGRIGLDISPVNPDFVYAIVEAAGDESGFYRSVDRGESWEKMSDYHTSGNYYQEILCDPSDLNTIYAMDVWMHYTTDGGNTFRMLGEKYKHVDNHAMWIDPDDNSHFIVGCDGGLYESYDGGENWKFFTNLPITQYYKVSVDNDYPFYNIYGGTQDNFSMGGPSRTTNIAGIVNSDWYITNGGDGFESVVDPENPDIVYAQSQYGWLVRYDRKSGEAIDIKPMERQGEEAYRWNWDAPLIVSPHQSTRLYFAANKVFRSDDRGNTWEVISDDLTRQIDRNKLPVMDRIWGMDAVAKNKSTSIYGNIVSLDESPLQEGLLYAGTDDGAINFTEDGGINWQQLVSFPGVPDTTYVNQLVASQHDTQTVYAVFNNHKRGDFKPYILVTRNKGKSWESISGNLPERGSVYSIAEDHEMPQLLFAGTEFGVFFTVDGGLNWTQLKANVPVIAVRDLAIQKRENDLVLGTFGRGFYVLDDYSPLRSLNSGTLEKEAHIFPVKKSWMFLESKPLGLRGKSFQGSAYYTAENPAVGAQFTYYLKDDILTRKEMRQKEEKKILEKGDKIQYPEFEEIREEDDEPAPKLFFTIKDGNGNIIRQLEAEPKKGIHRIVWDFHYPSTTPVKLTGPSFDNPFSEPDKGPLALPGTYQVSLFKFQDGKVTELVPDQSFETQLLNHVTLPARDKEAVFEFKNKVTELLRVVEGTNKTLEKLNEKVTYFFEAIKNTRDTPTELSERISAIDQQLKQIDRELNGDYSLKRREFPVPPAISDRINTIIYGLWSTTSAPTDTQRSSLEIAENRFEEVYDEIRNLTEITIPNLERDLEEAGAPWTPGRLPEWNK